MSISDVRQTQVLYLAIAICFNLFCSRHSDTCHKIDCGADARLAYTLC